MTLQLHMTCLSVSSWEKGDVSPAATSQDSLGPVSPGPTAALETAEATPALHSAFVTITNTQVKLLVKQGDVFQFPVLEFHNSR